MDKDQKKTIEPELKEPVNSEGAVLESKIQKLQCGEGFFISKAMQYEIISREEFKKKQERESTRINKKLWLETFEKKGGGAYYPISALIGISERTFYYWLERDKEFAEAVYRIRKNNINIIEDVLVAKAKSGFMPAVKLWLENNHPAYSRKLKVETYTGNKTYEDIIDEVNQEINEKKENENGNNNNEKGAQNRGGDNEERSKENNEPAPVGESIEDKKQEGGNSPVQTQPGSTVLLEKENEEKHNS